jgi:hypothetical protein
MCLLLRESDLVIKVDESPLVIVKKRAVHQCHADTRKAFAERAVLLLIVKKNRRGGKHLPGVHTTSSI